MCRDPERNTLVSDQNQPTEANRRGLPLEFDQGPPGFVFYRGSIPFDELPWPDEPRSVSEDYEWAFSNRELHQQYQGLVVAVHDRKVWGVGRTADDAWEGAHRQPGCPPEEEFAFVLMIGLPGQKDGSQRGDGA